MIISFAVAPKRTTKQIIIDIDRSIFSPCSRNVNRQNNISVDLIRFYIIIRQEIKTDFFPVIDSIPEIFL